MEHSEPLSRRAILQGLIGLLGVFAAIFLLAWVARDPISVFSTQLVQHYGLWGIFLVVALMDSIPGPGHDVGLVLGLAGGSQSAPTTSRRSAVARKAVR